MLFELAEQAPPERKELGYFAVAWRTRAVVSAPTLRRGLKRPLEHASTTSEESAGADGAGEGSSGDRGGGSFRVADGAEGSSSKTGADSDSDSGTVTFLSMFKRSKLKSQEDAAVEALRSLLPPDESAKLPRKKKNRQGPKRQAMAAAAAAAAAVPPAPPASDALVSSAPIADAQDL